MTSGPDTAITIAVPTRNRPAFLRRLLRYYEGGHARVPMVIADSSAAAARRENELTVAAAQRTLNATLKHPTGHFVNHCCAALRAVRTPYVVFCADDDFIVPDSLPGCVRYLKDHPEYSTVLGSSIVIETGLKSDCWLSTGYDLTQDDPAARFRQMSQQTFPIFYGVYRTAQLLEWFELAELHTDYTKGALFSEIMSMKLAVIMGKVRCFERLQNIRQLHAANESVVHRAIKDDADCRTLYAGIRRCLAEKLVLQSETMSQRTAERLVDSQMGAMGIGLQAWKRARRGHPGRRLWKNTIQRLLRVIGPTTGRQTVLNRHLRPGDPQQNDPDFLRIHDLVREFPEGIPAGPRLAAAG
jgi:glycosyltransferase domain-containing protein